MPDEWATEKSCCFTGNRYLSPGMRGEIGRWLDREILGLIGQGVVYFWAGGALGFDTMAARTVLRIRDRAYYYDTFGPNVPNARLGLALPCQNMDERWPAADRRVLAECIEMADRVVYTSREYYPGCMHLRNRFLADNSGVCLYYSARGVGGTAYTVRYAKKQGLRMIPFLDEGAT
ncbi:MAG: DUF1273 domain-containing protein [Oscillospiraceae bacterium]|nr:DUF1273 domain-containing protein [Oscillospiraceae bacterium]